jgi:hypothetical protein
VVVALVFATFNKPFVELTAALEVFKLNILPVVIALALIDNGISVVAVDQFHI